MIKNRLFLFLLCLVSLIMIPIGVLADDEEPYRLRIQHDYPNTDGNSVLFSDVCIMDDDGYAIFGVQKVNDDDNGEIVVLRYDPKYELVYKQAFPNVDLGDASILTGKLIPLPEGRVIVSFPKKAFLLDNDGTLIKDVALDSGEVNPIVRLGDSLVSVTPTKIYQYDLSLNLIKTKDVTLENNQVMMYSNIDNEVSFLIGYTLYNLDSNLNYKEVFTFSDQNLITPLVKIRNNKYIGLSAPQDNPLAMSYVITEDFNNVLLSRPDSAANGYLAMGHIFFGIMAQIKYASELDNGYVFTDQKLSEDNQTCTLSFSVYDTNYQLIYEKVMAEVPGFGRNQSETNAATILNSVARLRNGDFVLLYTTGHVTEDLEAHDVVFTYKRTVEVEEGTEDVYFDTDYYKPGDTVQIRFRKKLGFVVDEVSVKEVENSKEVVVNDDDYTFTMPDADVAVGVQWRKSSPVAQITENPKTGILFSIISIGLISIVLTFYEMERFKKKSSK